MATSTSILIIFFIVLHISNQKNINKLFVKSLEQLLPKKHLEEFSDGSPLYIIVHNKTRQHFLNSIVNFYSKKISIFMVNHKNILPSCKNFTCSKIQQIVGIYDQYHEVNSSNWIQTFDKRWNPRSSIIIWIRKKASELDVENLFENFWKLECINVIIIEYDELINDFNIYSYDPFRKNKNDKRGFVYNLKNENTFFQDKIRNLNGYSISFSMFERLPFSSMNKSVEGIENKIIKTFCSWLNCTIKINTAIQDANDYVTVLKDGTKIGPIGDILTNRSEILGNSFCINNVFEKDVEYSLPHFSSNYVVMVPEGHQEETFHALTRHLYSNITIPLVHFNLFIIAMYLRYRKEKNVFLKSWELLVFQHFHHISTDLVDRCLKIMWILFAMIITCAYQEYLYSNLKKPEIKQNLNTLRQVYDSNLELKTDDDIIHILKNSGDDVKELLGAAAKQQLKLSDCVHELLMTKKVACVVDQLLITSNKLDHLVHNDFPVIHIVKESLGQCWHTYIMKNGFPFKTEFNFIDISLKEAGIISRWITNDLRRIVHEKPVQLNKIKFRTIIGWTIGCCVVSTIIFLIELLLYYTKVGRSINLICKKIPSKCICV